MGLGLGFKVQGLEFTALRLNNQNCGMISSPRAFKHLAAAGCIPETDHAVVAAADQASTTVSLTDRE